MVTNPKLRYQIPINFVLLGVYTIMQSIIVGIFSSIIDQPRMICLGTIHTLASFSGITLWSFQNNEKFDLTPFGNVLVTSSICLIIGSILNRFFDMPLFDNILSGFLAVSAASYLAYDTQKIVSGKHHRYSYSEKEYILVVLNLYQDVINLFIQINKVFSKIDVKKSKQNE